MTDWSEIVGQYGPLVWRIAFRLLHHEADAADCFQRTFMSAVEMARTEKIKSWPAILQRLATARALEQLRQRCRQASRFAALPPEPGPDHKAHDPLNRASAGELAETLRQALTVIDQQQAEVFCLACLEDWSYQNIADHLGITVNHVGVLLNRARTALRERLKSHAPGAEHREKETQP
jgi:RNA polymerase sigma-70 factor (ECF subfamily)